MKRLMIAVALVAMAACSGGPTSPSDQNISGTWKGFSTVRSSNFTLSLVQTGGSLTGTWTDNFGFGGTISGTKSGASLNITLNGNSNSCSLSFTGTLATSLLTIDGTLTGLNCLGNAGGPLTLTKS